MANAVAQVTVPDERWTWTVGNKYIVMATISVTPSPATYVTGGIPMSFAAPLVKATRTPWFVEINGRSGYTYVYLFGPDAFSGTMKIYVQDGVAGNPLAEMANGLAIPAVVSSDYLTVEATFQGME